MRRDTLLAMVKLRRQAIADAKRRLAETIGEEDRAAAANAAAERRLTEEAEAAADLAGGDDAVEAYARWLPTGLRAAGETRAALDIAATEVSHARATLDAARAAAELADEALESCDKAALAERARREQAELDERGARPRPPF